MRSMLEKSALWINDFLRLQPPPTSSTSAVTSTRSNAPGTSFTALIPWVIFKVALMPLLTTHEPLYWAFTTYLTTCSRLDC